MKKTIGEQVAQFMDARDMKSADMAVLVETSRQNIEGLIKRNRFPRGYIDRLAKAMGVTVDTLLAGKYVPPKSIDGSISVDGTDAKENSQASRQKIPTNAVFTPLNLSATILLLGSMLARMDPRSRRMMGVLLADLADSPDDAHDVAEKASGIASKQKAVTSSKSLDAAIQGKDGAFVETAPARLE